MGLNFTGSDSFVDITLSHSTLVGNNSPGGSIYGLGDAFAAHKLLKLTHNILGNDGSSPNIVSNGFDVTSQGYNLSNDNGSGFLTATGDQINANPKLGDLADNGGPTLTYLPLPDSPAIEAGDPAYSGPLTTDQRGEGFPRVLGRIDIGAVELTLSALSVDDPRVFAEGTPAGPGSTTFTITLNQASERTVTVNYATADGTAKAGSDYIATSGSLTFAPGETSKTVKVKFIADNIPEPTETFFLDLSSSVGASLAKSRGTATIANEDGPSIAIQDAETITEGNTGTKPQKFTVTLSAPSTRQVRVNWTTANGTAGPNDYVAASGVLDFAPGQTSKPLTVYVKCDRIAEPDETYKILLSNPQYGVLSDNLGIATILNDDAAPFSADPEQPSQ